MYNPKIYSASKIWHNIKWCVMRDRYGFDITARWINEECGSFSNPTGAKQFTPAEKVELWKECHKDVSDADMVICYAEERDELRGAVMEMGICMGQNKPIYIIGDCPFFRGNDRSDAAYMHHPLMHRIEVTKFDDGSYHYLEGYQNSVKHYLANYRKVFYEGFTSRISGVFQKAATDSLGVLRAKETALYKTD